MLTTGFSTVWMAILRPPYSGLRYCSWDEFINDHNETVRFFRSVMTRRDERRNERMRLGWRAMGWEMVNWLSHCPRFRDAMGTDWIVNVIGNIRRNDGININQV